MAVAMDTVLITAGGAGVLGARRSDLTVSGDLVHYAHNFGNCLRLFANARCGIRKRHDHKQHRGQRDTRQLR